MNSVCATDCQNRHLAFKGTPVRVGYFNIKNYQDAIRNWEILKSAKYLDCHTDSFANRMIRQENYSFLEKLSSNYDKENFIRNFCEFTGFPNLKKISNFMDWTFRDTIDKVGAMIGNCGKVVDAGYDPTCSLGLKKSFPGSDLDKGYVILEGNSGYMTDEEVVNSFKGRLWDNLDNRIVSQNHPETAIDVYTKNQVKQKLDDIATKVALMKYKPGLMTLFTMLTGLAIAGLPADIVKRHFLFTNIKNSKETDPYEAALFNRKLAGLLSKEDKVKYKNFAFFIETVEANLKKNPYGKTDDIFKQIKDSSFVQYSNVTQIGAWQKRIDNGYLKTKLRNREKLEQDFNHMTLDTKYDLVKDIIKSSSNDQSSRFSQYFKNDDDIKDRYQKLLDSLV